VPILNPQVQSASGGWHIYFSVPEGIDASTLRQPDAIKGLINVRAGNGFTVCAGSTFEGKPYVLMSDVPPYPAPAALVEHCMRKAALTPTTSKAGEHDAGDTAAMLKWMAEQDAFADYESWISAGMALKASFGDGGLDLWKHCHDETVEPHVEATKWNSFSGEITAGCVTINSLFDRAHKLGWTGTVRRSIAVMFDNAVERLAQSPPIAPSNVAHGVQLEDFISLTSQTAYVFIPTRELWTRVAVQSALPKVDIGGVKPISPAVWLDQNHAAQQVVWAPGRPLEIKDRLFDNGAWVERAGCNTLNLYKPPNIVPKAGDASRWINHVHQLFPEEAAHLINWLAHRVQKPGEKINHAVVLGGEQGIGKDTLLEPVKVAVGPWNFGDVTPTQMMGRFNAFLNNVILRVNETRDRGDNDRVGFYEHSKTICAAPPDVHRVDEKHVKEYNVMNVVGMVVTTNNRDSLFLPSDDRRYFVAWNSTLEKSDFSQNYWNEFYGWLDNGGNESIAHFLHNLDLSGFDPKAPPPKTRGWSQIVRGSCSPDDSEMRDALERFNNPPAVTVGMLATGLFGDWLRHRDNRKRIPHRFKACGYVEIENPDAKDGRWRIGNSKHHVYARKELSIRDQSAAAAALTPEAIEALHKQVNDRYQREWEEEMAKLPKTGAHDS
jgi:hypothetical protein